MATNPIEIEDDVVTTFVGRPTDYRPEYATIAEKLYQRGLTDKEVADIFGVNPLTLHRWAAVIPEFCKTRVIGKGSADDRVERSMYHRAVGYDYEEEQAIKVKVGKDLEQVEVVTVQRHQPADTTAQVFWLKNRRYRDWKDKREVSLQDDREPSQFDIRLLPAEYREQFRQLLVMMLPPEQQALMAPIEGEFTEADQDDG